LEIQNGFRTRKKPYGNAEKTLKSDKIEKAVDSTFKDTTSNMNFILKGSTYTIFTI
jgi:hypothetical protein